MTVGAHVRTKPYPLSPWETCDEMINWVKGQPEGVIDFVTGGWIVWLPAEADYLALQIVWSDDFYIYLIE